MASEYIKMDRKSIRASNDATICTSPSLHGGQFSQNTSGLATVATLATNPVSRLSYLPGEREGVGYTVATPGYTFLPPVQYCSDGQHLWFPRCEGDGGMLQCSKCPQVQEAKDGSGADRGGKGERLKAIDEEGRRRERHTG